MQPAFADRHQWSSELKLNDYLIARYEIISAVEGVQAAIGIAMEQSVTNASIAHFANQTLLSASTIRVIEVCDLGPCKSILPDYQLPTPVYPTLSQQLHRFAITLAIPLLLIANKASQLLNILIGEIPRLGYIQGFKLLEARLPNSFGRGPTFGIDGIRKYLRQDRTPILCRSMRPAVGLDLATMERLNYEVLSGGFHIIKDDELIAFPRTEDFRLHIASMLRARDQAIAAQGEKKLYFANLICEPWELQERWKLCCEMGVDGVLIAPWIQGIGLVQHLAQQKKMLILAHNTMGEMISRHPDWCVSEVVMNHWLRCLGADLIVTPGGFAEPLANEIRGDTIKQLHNSALQSMIQEEPNWKPSMPILQGGKNPFALKYYRDSVGSKDFMLIVASWVDEYKDGLRAGARFFREAVDNMD